MEGSKSGRQSFKAYYLEPKSERGTFARYMEESGVNALLIDAVSKLFQVTDKPENPMEWLRLYFRQFDPDRTEQLQVAEQSLKDAVIKQESKLTYLRMTESRHKERLDGLQYRAKQSELQALHETQDDNYHRYKDHADDFRWRIKPDPSFHVKKGDILGEMIEHEGVEGPGRPKSRIEIDTLKDVPDAEQEEATCNADPDDNYDDYPKLYFGIEDEAIKETVDGMSSLPLQADSSVRPHEGQTSLMPYESEEEFEDDEKEYNYEDQDELGSLKSNPALKRSSSMQVKPPSSSTREQKKLKKKSKVPPRLSMEETLPENNTSEDIEETGEVSSSAPGTGDSSGNVKTKGKHNLKASNSEVLDPLPEDPLALELPPVDPTFWKQDFSVTKGRAAIFDKTDEFDFEDEILDDDVEHIGSYLSSRGEMRQRKLRSQIISEAYWKPDRGRSIQFDSKFDLADIPILSSHVSGVFPNPQGNLLSPDAGSPSHVSAIASDCTIRYMSSPVDGPRSVLRKHN